jgi:hypothetical protein
MNHGRKLKAVLFAGVVLTAAGLAYCNKSDESGAGEHDHSGMQSAALATQSVEAGDLRVTFEVMDQKAHEAMIAHMGGGAMSATMKALPYHLMLSVVDKTSGAAVTDATIQLSLTGPDGRAVTTVQEMMTGGGMQHECAGFEKTGAGVYSAVAQLTYKGRTLAPAAALTLP